MNDIVNKFLLTGDKFMPHMHLRQLGFVYSACGPFTKHKERINKFMKTGDTRYIYRNNLDKAWFQHDDACSKSRDLGKRNVSDRVLRDKAFNIANNPQYNGYERGLASMVYKFFDKKQASETSEQTDGDVHRSPSIDFNESDDNETPLQAIYPLYKKNLSTPLQRNKEQASETSRANKVSQSESENESPLQVLLGRNYESYMAKRKKRISKENEQLANELHKPIIRKLKKRKVQSAYIDEIWAADLADMQLLSKKKKELHTYYALSICFLDMHLLFR